MFVSLNRAAKLALIPALAAVVFALAACADAGTSEPECEDGGERWMEYRLFMGAETGKLRS